MSNTVIEFLAKHGAHSDTRELARALQQVLALRAPVPEEPRVHSDAYRQGYIAALVAVHGAALDGPGGQHE